MGCGTWGGASSPAAGSWGPLWASTPGRTKAIRWCPGSVGLSIVEKLPQGQAVCPVPPLCLEDRISGFKACLSHDYYGWSPSNCTEDLITTSNSFLSHLFPAPPIAQTVLSFILSGSYPPNSRECTNNFIPCFVTFGSIYHYPTNYWK